MAHNKPHIGSGKYTILNIKNNSRKIGYDYRDNDIIYCWFCLSNSLQLEIITY